jgi:hypothetical protein
MGISMIVRKAFRPGGSGSPLLEPGSPFEASTETQAKLCRAMGWCENAPAGYVAPAPAAEPTDDEPPRRVAKKAAKKTSSKRGTYSRRDLTAE